MTFPAEIQNFAAYMLQVALIGIIGTLLPRVFRIRTPGVLLPYWQLMLAFCLLFPLAAPRHLPSATVMHEVVGAPATLQADRTATPATVDSAAAHGPEVSWPVVFAVLVVGCLIRLGWLVMGLINLRLLRANAHRLACLTPDLQDLVSRIGVRPEILVSPEIPGPATFGLLRQTILLPEEFETMDVGTQASILSHELIHVRRRDWLFTLGERLVLALFWFHPAVWWLARHIDTAREQVVDEQVLAIPMDRRQYLQSLLNMAGRRTARVSASFFLAGHHLKERVALILEEVPMSRMRVIVSLVSIAILSSGGALVAAYVFPLTGSAVLQLSNGQTPIASPSMAPAKPVVIPETPPAAAPPVKQAVQPNQVRVVPVAPPKPPVPEKPVAGQVALAGKVVDQDGVPVAGASYTIYQTMDPVNSEMKDLIVTDFTDAQGGFKASVPVGILEIRVGHKGYGTFVTLNGIRSIEAAPTTIRVLLQIAGESQVVLITAGHQASVAEGPERAGEDVTPVRVIHRVDPAYPEEALQQKVEGTVVLEVRVGADGSVANVRVRKGVPELNEAAIKAVEQWRYDPAYLHGQPRSCTVIVTMIFKL